MEKQRTNDGPRKESADKHSIYTPKGVGIAPVLPAVAQLETLSTYAVLSLATRACQVLLQTTRTPRQGPMSKKILHTAHTCTIVSPHAQQ